MLFESVFLFFKCLVNTSRHTFHLLNRLLSLLSGTTVYLLPPYSRISECFGKLCFFFSLPLFPFRPSVFHHHTGIHHQSIFCYDLYNVIVFFWHLFLNVWNKGVELASIDCRFDEMGWIGLKKKSNNDTSYQHKHYLAKGMSIN